MATDKQIEANRLNAQKSTGPITDEGKAVSRGNALKHGLSGAGVVLAEEELELIEVCEAEWHSSLKPHNAFDLHLAHRIAVEAVRIDRIERAERELRGRLALRAEVCWDDDQQLAVEKLGKGLARNPGLNAILLSQTVHGCDWLLERWEALERALVERGAWTPAQRERALDLLGTAADLRDLPTILDPPPGGDAVALGLALARGEIAYLKEKREKLQPLDDAERAAAIQGYPTKVHPSLTLLRRYESACQRRKAWALKHMQQGAQAAATAMPARASSSPLSDAEEDDRALALLDEHFKRSALPPYDESLYALPDAPSPVAHDRR